MKTLLILLALSLLSTNLYAAKFKAGDCYKSKKFEAKAYFAEIIGVLSTNYLVVSTKFSKYDRTVTALPIDEVDKHMVKIDCPKI